MSKLVIVLAALSLAACSESGSGLVPGSLHGNAHGAKTTMRIVIDGPRRPAARSRVRRGPRFVSPSTNGLAISIWPHGAAHTPGNAIVQTAIDVSSGSPACGGAAGFPRTCTASFDSAPQTDDFSVQSYDAPPTGGVISPTAHLLGIGSATLAVNPGQANALIVYLCGVVAGFGTTPGFLSLPNTGTPATVALVIKPTDFGNNPISAGVNDPLANPISVSLSETGGSGHAALVLNGGAPAATAVVSNTSDTLQLVYDGVASPGYGVIVTFSASAVNGFGGATQQVYVSPLFVSTAFYRPASNTLTLPLGDVVPITLTEYYAKGSLRYTATPSGCSGIVTAGTVSGGGTIASIGLTTSTTTSTGGCTVAFSDGSTTANVPVTNGAPNLFVSEYPIPTVGGDPIAITPGPDGALWFTESADNVGRIPVNATPGSGAQISEYPTGAGTSPVGITTGPDGQVWFAECNAGDIGEIPTSATPGSGAQITTYAATTGHPYGLTTGPDANVWFGDHQAGIVKRMTPSGQVVATHSSLRTNTDNFITGPGGVVWFTECNPTGAIGAASPSGGLQEFGTAQGMLVNAAPYDLTVGSDGNIWFTDFGTDSIGKATVTLDAIHRPARTNAIHRHLVSSVAIAEFPLPPGVYPLGITSGPDGALWFADGVNGAIGRIPTDATVSDPQVTEYPLPTAASRPEGITAGPDGALWVVEFGGNKIARISIGGADVRSTFRPSRQRSITTTPGWARRGAHRWRTR